jgi:hypothetical protein
MRNQGGAPGNKQGQGQSEEVLRVTHPIQINLFKEIHAHSDPLEFDTNLGRFVPEIVTFLLIPAGSIFGQASSRRRAKASPPRRDGA